MAADASSDHRLNVTFPAELIASLETLAARRGKSVAQLVRDAVALELLVQESLEGGARFLIERDGERRELWIR